MQHEDTYLKKKRSISLTGPAEDPYLGASDAGVVLVREDSNGDTPAMQREYGPAQLHVGKCKDTQVQRGGSRQDVSEKTGERGLYTMRQGAETGTGKAQNKRRAQRLS